MEKHIENMYVYKLFEYRVTITIQHICYARVECAQKNVLIHFLPYLFFLFKFKSAVVQFLVLFVQFSFFRFCFEFLFFVVALLFFSLVVVAVVGPK